MDDQEDRKKVLMFGLNPGSGSSSAFAGRSTSALEEEIQEFNASLINKNLLFDVSHLYTRKSKVQLTSLLEKCGYEEIAVSRSKRYYFRRNTNTTEFFFDRNLHYHGRGFSYYVCPASTEDKVQKDLEERLLMLRKNYNAGYGEYTFSLDFLMTVGVGIGMLYGLTSLLFRSSVDSAGLGAMTMSVLATAVLLKEPITIRNVPLQKNNEYFKANYHPAFSYGKEAIREALTLSKRKTISRG